jgi:hypothetical protein
VHDEVDAQACQLPEILAYDIKRCVKSTCKPVSDIHGAARQFIQASTCANLEKPYIAMQIVRIGVEILAIAFVVKYNHLQLRVQAVVGAIVAHVRERYTPKSSARAASPLHDFQ